MPFRSEKQMRFLFATHPALAKKWLREYGPYRPKRAKRRKRG